LDFSCSYLPESPVHAYRIGFSRWADGFTPLRPPRVLFPSFFVLSFYRVFVFYNLNRRMFISFPDRFDNYDFGYAPIPLFSFFRVDWFFLIFFPGLGERFSMFVGRACYFCAPIFPFAIIDQVAAFFWVLFLLGTPAKSFLSFLCLPLEWFLLPFRPPSTDSSHPIRPCGFALLVFPPPTSTDNRSKRLFIFD